MNILMISKVDLSRPTGETEHFLGLATGFTKLGHRVTIISQQSIHKNYFEFKCFTIKPLTRIKSLNLLLFQIRLLFLLPIIIQYIKPDFIYIRTSPFFIVAHIVAKLFGKKIVSEVNGLNKSEFTLLHTNNRLILSLLLLIEKNTYYLSNKIVAISSPLKKYLIKNFHIKKNKIISVTNGCSLENIKKNKVREEVKTIGFIGSILPWHGLDILIQSYKILFKKHNNLHLLILGSDKINDKEYNIESIKTSTKSGTDRYMRKFDLAIIPTVETINNTKIIASSPIKFFDYLRRGVPILCSDVEELSDIILDNNIGLIFKQGNITDCADKLNKILELSYKERLEISNRMRLLAEKYDWKIVASKIIDFVYN